jgi:hypothetical protein
MGVEALGNATTNQIRGTQQKVKAWWMAEAKALGGAMKRGRGWFSGEKKLFFDLQKTAIRKSMVSSQDDIVDLQQLIVTLSPDSLSLHYNSSSNN